MVHRWPKYIYTSYPIQNFVQPTSYIKCVHKTEKNIKSSRILHFRRNWYKKNIKSFLELSNFQTTFIFVSFLDTMSHVAPYNHYPSPKNSSHCLPIIIILLTSCNIPSHYHQHHHIFIFSAQDQKKKKRERDEIKKGKKGVKCHEARRRKSRHVSCPFFSLSWNLRASVRDKTSCCPKKERRKKVHTQ